MLQLITTTLKEQLAAYETGDIRRNTNHEHSRRRYYLPRAEIKNYNVLIDGRNFYDQNLNSSIVRYNELLKMTTGRSEDYSTVCLLDYDYYLKDFNIAGIDLSHQAVLDSDPKINQHIEFIYKYQMQLMESLNCFRKGKTNSLKI